MADFLKYFLELNPFNPKIVYLQGVPNLNETFIVKFLPDKNGLQFQNESRQNKFYIARKDIINLSVEDQSTIQSRVGFGRLLMVGIFAFAWKKKETVPLSFLIIEYKDEFGDQQEMYLQSDAKEGFQNFTNIKYNLKRFWAEVADHPNADNIIATSNRNFTEKKEKESSNSAIGCVVFASIALIVFLFFLISNK